MLLTPIPNVTKFPKMREHKFDLSSIELTAENIESYDAVILLTNHSDFDYGLIEEHASVLVDTRGQYRNAASHITKGLNSYVYLSLGNENPE